MKTTLLLLLSMSILNAADVTWNGATSGSPSYNDGSNWSGGVTPAAGDTIIFGNNLTLNDLITTTKINLSGSSVIIGNNSEVKLGEGHGYDINENTNFIIGDGSKLYLKGSHNWNNQTLNLNLNTSGRLEIGNPAENTNNLTFNIQLTPDASAAGTTVTRELAHFTYSLTGGDADLNLNLINWTNNDGYTKLDGIKDASITAPSSITLNQGEYRFVVTKGDHGSSSKLWIQYNAIPEPSTASLGLLGLGMLMLKRKRRS